MAKTVYMVADDEARAIFENEFDQWSKIRSGSVRVDSVRLDALKCISEYSGTIYRCEPIEHGNDVPEERRTVKAYVQYDPDKEDGPPQDIWACASESLARASWPISRIFEIEMRKVTSAAKRETGWIVKGPRGLAFGTYGSRGNTPCFFSESTAKELASSSYYSEGGAVAIEVYRDTLGPVDDE